jgi:hypothetical protein
MTWNSTQTAIGRLRSCLVARSETRIPDRAATIAIGALNGLKQILEPFEAETLVSERVRIKRAVDMGRCNAVGVVGNTS